MHYEVEENLSEENNLFRTTNYDCECSKHLPIQVEISKVYMLLDYLFKVI